ncbi:MAG: T9SS type A sorting domain-containing protein [Bacteroidetes bacterium]|nr:T9SS type A sorting domain-containing protein [Bacteroidota bacterium]
MKLTSLLLFLCCFFINSAVAQSYVPCWSEMLNGNDPAWSGHANPVIQGSAKVSDGVLVCGTEYEHVWKGKNGDSVGRTMCGGAYIAKYDFNGNLKWVDYGKDCSYTTRGSIYDCISSVTTDEKENIYICGKFYGKDTFWYNKGLSNVRISMHDTSYHGPAPFYFIAKLDKNGNVLWHNSLNSMPWHIAYDNHGRLLLEGEVWSGDNYYYRLADTTKTLSISYSPANIDENYLYWIDTAGKLLKWTNIHSDGPNNIGITHMATDKDGSVYLAGSFEDDVRCYNTNLLTYKEVQSWSAYYWYGRKFFLAKYDSTATPKWICFDKLTLTDNDGSMPVSLKTDDKDNVYVAVYGSEHYLYDSMYFYNGDSSVTNIPRRAYNLFCIKGNGKLKWTSYGGMSWPTGLLVSDTAVAVCGYNSELYYYKYYAPSNDTFYSAKSTKKYWLPHQLPNIALAYYDTSGNIKYAVRTGKDVTGNVYNLMARPDLDMVRGDSNSIILSGVAGPNGVVYFGDTLQANGEDGVVMKTTPGCDTLNMPKAPPRIYIKNPFSDVLCKGDSLYIYDTVISSFASTNKFVIEMFDYYSEGAYYHVRFDSSVGSKADSFKCKIPVNFKTDYYAIRIITTDPEYTSPIMQVYITGPVQPKASLSVSPNIAVFEGDTVMFVASALYPGHNPVYKWFVNGVEVPSITGDTYITDSLNNGDNVYALLTSDYRCRSIDTTSTNHIVMSVAGIKDVSGDMHYLSVSPNPNTGVFCIHSDLLLHSYLNISIMNALGQVIYIETVTGNKTTRYNLDLRSLASGVYYIRCTNDKESISKKILINK